MLLGDYGQPRLQKILNDMLGRGRVDGSFLFDGPVGVGKEALGVELGRLLNCENGGSCPPRGLFKPTPVATDEEVCSSCRRFRNLQHPDLHLIFPVPSKFWENEADASAKLRDEFRDREPASVLDILRGRAIDPYYKPAFGRPLGIQAEVLRDTVMPAVQRRPVVARFKVIVISDAEQMAFGIGNLLLKTLEEPPPDCLLILTSAVPNRLLPTIRSRCQRLTFAPLPSEWMVPRLELLYGVGRTKARLAATLSRGSMLMAGRFLSGVFEDVRDRAFEIMRAAAGCEVLDLLDLAKSATKEYTRDDSKRRALLPLLLQLVALIARDMLFVVEEAGAELELVNNDRKHDLQELARSFSSQGLRRVIRQAEEAERQIARYAHTELTLNTLFLGLARESDKARAMAGRD
jgi:DNA polymerase-3 subunit delta'